MDVTNVCKKLDCPYFSDDYKKSWGCQKFAVALHCPLVKELPDQLSTEYALYTAQYNPALKDSLKDFLTYDADYEKRFNLKYPKSEV
ncbi:MAG: hypothetical protein IM613_12340 [Cytophagales bacterium]|nr:hypothetical protein [Cytophagales bacterium]